LIARIFSTKVSVKEQTQLHSHFAFEHQRKTWWGHRSVKFFLVSDKQRHPFLGANFQKCDSFLEIVGFFSTTLHLADRDLPKDFVLLAMINLQKK